MLDHHPYGIFGPTWHALDAGDVAVPDIVKLTRVLHAAETLGTVLPSGHKQVWVTEISWDTKPPDPSGVPIATQARWLEQSFYVLWRQGVDTVLWWQLADAPPIPNYASTYQAGVYFLNGDPKPGATAFEFPFVATRVQGSSYVLWGIPPASGPVTIEALGSHVWHAILTIRGQAHRIFTHITTLPAGTSVRATLPFDRYSLPFPA